MISTAFTPTSGPADPASNVSYAAGAMTDSATVVATAVNASDLTGVATVVTGASTGISSASWDPTISVIVPADFAPGVYGATVDKLSCVTVRRLWIAVLVLAGVIIPAGTAQASPTAHATAPTGGIGIRLVGVPTGSSSDPLARLYIMNRITPGTSLQRQIEVSNGTHSTAHVALYAAGAYLGDDRFRFASGHIQDQLSSWTSVSRDAVSLLPGGDASETRDDQGSEGCLLRRGLRSHLGRGLRTIIGRCRCHPREPGRRPHVHLDRARRNASA